MRALLPFHPLGLHSCLRGALLLAVCVSGSSLFLLDCGGSSFSSGSSAGSGGLAEGGATGGGPSGGSAGQTARGGTASGSAGASQGGRNSGGNSAIAGTGGVSAAGAAGMVSGGTGGMLSSVCPASVPTGACVSGLVCSYGADLRGECRNVYTCANGAWLPVVAHCSPLQDCFQRDGGFVQAGSACDSLGEDCSFDGGQSGTIYCRCGACVGTECKQEWDCIGPPAKPCPALLPNQGQPCDTNDESCKYGMCSDPQGLADMVCSAHVWAKVGIACAK